MNQIIELRSNIFYSEEMKPVVELVLIHTDGKSYTVNDKKKNLNIETKISDTRFFMNAKNLSAVITELIAINLKINEKES